MSLAQYEPAAAVASYPEDARQRKLAEGVLSLEFLVRAGQRDRSADGQTSIWAKLPLIEDACEAINRLEDAEISRGVLTPLSTQPIHGMLGRMRDAAHAVGP